MDAIVFFINYYDIDIEHLSTAFESLGYKTEKLKNLDSFENLREEICNKIEKETQNKMIEKVVVIFLGYGVDSQYMFIGDDNDIVSCREFCKLFSSNIFHRDKSIAVYTIFHRDKSIAVYTNLCYKLYQGEGEIRLYDDDDFYDYEPRDTEQLTIIGDLKTGLLFSRALANELNEIIITKMTSEISFSDVQYRIQKYICKYCSEDDPIKYGNRFPCFIFNGYGQVKSFLFSKTDNGGEIDASYKQLGEMWRKKKEEPISRLVFFINYYDIDIEPLSAAFENLGYTTVNVNNLDSFENLQNEIINKIERNIIIKNVVVIFLGYGFDDHYMFIGDEDVVSIHKFCALFSSNVCHPDKIIAVFINLCYKPQAKGKILDNDNVHYYKPLNTEKIIILGNVQTGLLFSQALANELNQITNTSKISQFSYLILRVKKYIRKCCKDDHIYIDYGNYKKDSPCFIISSSFKRLGV